MLLSPRFGFFVQALHFFTVPETRSTIILDRIAKQRRASGVRNIWGPNEVNNKRLTMKEIGTIWIRPFYMLFTVSPRQNRLKSGRGSKEAEFVHPLFLQRNLSSLGFRRSLDSQTLSSLLSYKVLRPYIRNGVSAVHKLALSSLRKDSPCKAALQ